MKTFVTAQLTKEGIGILSKHLTLSFGGWGYEGVKLSPEQLVERAKDCEILIIGYEDINEYVLKNLPQLKFIACTRGGVENIDIEVVKKYGVILTNTPGRNATAVADLTLGLMLSIVRHISQTHRFIMEKRWDKVSWDIAGNTPYKRFSGIELEGKTLGLIGYGAIGKKVEKRALGFGMNVIVYDPYLIPNELNSNVQMVDLDTLLKESVIVSLHCKLTKETKELINKKVFEKMSENSYLINTARGGLVHEGDLYQVLKEKRIAGAALDAIRDEPINNDHPFFELDNILITPHIGGASNDIISHQTNMVVEDVLRYINKKD